MTEGSSRLLEKVGVDYVDTSQTDYQGTVTVYLDRNGLEVDSVYPFMDALRKALPFVTDAYPELSRDSIRVVVNLQAIRESYRDVYLDKERAAKLAEILNPKYTRKVSGTAKVMRHPDGSHRQTRVTLTRCDGPSFDELADAVEDYTDRKGVLRAYVSPRGTIVFSMQKPAVSDRRGQITGVAADLADDFNMMLVEPVTVADSDPDERVDPASDHGSTATEPTTEEPETANA